jgi:hypothetical protein
MHEFILLFEALKSEEEKLLDHYQLLHIRFLKSGT